MGASGGELLEWQVAIRGKRSGARANELVDFISYMEIHPIAICPSCSVQRGALGATFTVLAATPDEARLVAQRIWADVTSIEIDTAEINAFE